MSKDSISKVLVSSFAEEDIQNIVDYYKDLDGALSEDFIVKLSACFERIEQLPEGYQKRYNEFRIAFLKRFSFGVFYKIYEKEITVVAVLHTSQDMSKWLKER